MKCAGIRYISGFLSLSSEVRSQKMSQRWKVKVKDGKPVLQKGRVQTRKKTTTIANTMPEKERDVIKLPKKVCRISHGRGRNAKRHCIL